MFKSFVWISLWIHLLTESFDSGKRMVNTTMWESFQICSDILNKGRNFESTKENDIFIATKRFSFFEESSRLAYDAEMNYFSV